MANDAFMKPEVPDAFRELMRVSIEQAKRAFDTFAATSEKTWKTFETSSQTASSGLRSLNEKIAEITRNNAEANFALAMKLAESKDVGQAMELQTRPYIGEYWARSCPLLGAKRSQNVAVIRVR